jgi:type I restriction enzyme S subunit
MSKIDDLIARLCPQGVVNRPLKEVCTDFIVPMRDRPKVFEGEIPWCRIEDIDGQVINGSKIGLGVTPGVVAEMNLKVYPVGTVIASCSASLGRYAINTKPLITNQTFIGIVCGAELFNRFLLYMLEISTATLVAVSNSGTIPYISRKKFEDLTIPVPPIEIQREIVSILDQFTELEAELEVELEARRKQYEHYRNELFTFKNIEGGVRTMCLADILEYEQPTKYLVASKDYSDEFAVPVLTAGQTFLLGFTNEMNGIYEATPANPVIIFDDFTTSFKWVDFKFKVKSSAMKMLTPRSAEVDFRYVYYAMSVIGFSPTEHARHWISMYSQFEIPVPSIEVQFKIVDSLDKFEKITSDLASGLPAEIEARRKQYEYYRDKLLTFKELEVA